MLRFSMMRVIHLPNGVEQRNRRSCILAFFWLAGLLGGIFCFLQMPDSFAALTGSAASGSFFFHSALITAFLPLLFTAVAGILGRPYLLCVICFLEAFLLLLISLGIRFSSASGGWLLSVLLLADRWGGVCFLYGIWLRMIRSSRKWRIREFLPAVCVLLFTEVSYYCLFRFILRVLQ